MEVLVASVAGIIVTAALFSILDFSLKQTTSLADKVQANQSGRIAMTKILHELQSACISPSFTPVQAGSTGSELIFIGSYSKEALIPNAIEHKIVYSKTEKTITDKAYNSNGGSWPNFTFPSLSGTPSSTTRLASNVTEGESKGKTVSIFRYYPYGTASIQGNSSEFPLNTLSEQPIGTKEPAKELPLSAATAATVAGVLVTYNAAAADGSTASNRSVTFTGQVILSFSVPNSETPIHDAPCQ